MTACDIFQALR